MRRRYLQVSPSRSWNFQAQLLIFWYAYLDFFVVVLRKIASSQYWINFFCKGNVHHSSGPSKGAACSAPTFIPRAYGVQTTYYPTARGKCLPLFFVFFCFFECIILLLLSVDNQIIHEWFHGVWPPAKSPSRSANPQAAPYNVFRLRCQQSTSKSVDWQVIHGCRIGEQNPRSRHQTTQAL
jgi:hypothetical protein